MKQKTKQPKTLELTVKQYADRKGVDLTVPGVHKQIKEGRLPKGVTARKIGSYYTITITKGGA